jgi:hypothetical protein
MTLQAQKQTPYLLRSLPFLIMPFAIFAPIQYFGLLGLIGLPDFRNEFVYFLAPFVWFADVVRGWRAGTTSIYEVASPVMMGVAYCSAFLLVHAIMTMTALAD